MDGPLKNRSGDPLPLPHAGPEAWDPSRNAAQPGPGVREVEALAGLVSVSYAEFKALENNVRVAFDKLRELNGLVSETVALVRDMQTRLSNVETALHGTAQRGGADGGT